MDAMTEALAVVGAGGVLRREQARAAMDEVMLGGVPDARFGALFFGLHARGETVEELVGFAQSMRSHVLRVDTDDLGCVVDTCGTGGDGADTFNVSTCAAFVARGCDVVIAKHGNRAVSSCCGSADVLEALGGRLETTPELAREMLETTGFAFLFAPSFHPSMRHAAGPRRALGTRTAFNLLGPITNPAGVRRQVVGVGGGLDVAERLADALRELGCAHALVVCGSDGLDELTLSGSSTVLHVTPDGVRRSEVAPEDVGLTRAPVAAIGSGGDVAASAAIARSVVAGASDAARRDVVLLNAAAALVVAGRTEDLREGVELARRTIESGAALAALDLWVTESSAEVAA